jgi:hypothetical protein
VNWDVEELERRKVEIKDENLLTIILRGKFGGPNITVKRPSK